MRLRPNNDDDVTELAQFIEESDEENLEDIMENFLKQYKVYYK